MANPTKKRGTSLAHQTKLGRSDRYPSDYGIRDKEDASRQRGDKGRGPKGLSKGIGASGQAGPKRERSRNRADKK